MPRRRAREILTSFNFSPKLHSSIQLQEKAPSSGIIRELFFSSPLVYLPASAPMRTRMLRAFSPKWQPNGHARSMASFAELYRNSVDNAIVQPGDNMVGHVVGRRRPRSSKQRFYVVDFGLKTEAPFSSREIPGASAIGDSVSMPLIEMEDVFNEPQFDFERRSELPALQAERYELLTKMNPKKAQLLHGRFATFKRGGASIKVLGVDAFAPRHHVVAVDRPLLGSYAPFYVLSMNANTKGTGVGASLDINPVVSSYGGYLFTLANLVGLDSAWEASGGGSPKERISYLRLLTRLLYHKNTAVRKIMPKHSERDTQWSSQHSARQSSRRGPWLDNIQPAGGRSEELRGNSEDRSSGQSRNAKITYGTSRGDDTRTPQRDTSESQEK